MVRTSLQGKLHMRKHITIRAAPLDAVPERRTKRCSPRFRPGDRFRELSFRYLSRSREGEKCRSLDHMKQTPFIHSSRFITSNNSLYIIHSVPVISFMWYTRCVLEQCIFDNCACALAEFRTIIQVMLCSIW